MVTATQTRPGTDPDRASFTTALEAARDQLTAARGVITPPGPPDLAGNIGRAVLATLLPARRPRYSTRKVKCATSRYAVRDDARPATTTAITITITITPPPPATPVPPPRPHTRRHHVTAIMTASPGRTWTGRELATLTGIRPKLMLAHLAGWTRHGWLTRTAPGTYTLNTPANPASSTTAPGP